MTENEVFIRLLINQQTGQQTMKGYGTGGGSGLRYAALVQDFLIITLSKGVGLLVNILGGRRWENSTVETHKCYGISV